MNVVLMLLSAALLLGGFALLIPIGVFFVECMAALLPGRSNHRALQQRPTIGVLVPAHNEAGGIAATLETLLPQLTEQDTLLVVADNCTDETAEISRVVGASVVERQDSQRRGKGYALDFGVQVLAERPPEVVVIVDADCTVAPGAIEQIARVAVTRSRPVQATYLLSQPAQPSPKDAVSMLAFTVKNLVRPAGLHRLGMPSLLTGTGMALPWSLIAKTPLASGNIVEDMQLGLDLAIVGYPPTFCAEARVTGALPGQNNAAKSQRTRWEHGHLQTLLTQVPRLLQAAVQQKRGDLLALALDLCVPPLSLLVMLWLLVMGCSAIASLTLGIHAPAALLAAEGGLLLLAVLAAWGKYARRDLPLGALLSVPLYVLWKIPLYFAFLVKPQTKWVRTERDALNSPKS